MKNYIILQSGALPVAALYSSLSVVNNFSFAISPSLIQPNYLSSALFDEMVTATHLEK